jgi:hypothetical protein
MGERGAEPGTFAWEQAVELADQALAQDHVDLSLNLARLLAAWPSTPHDCRARTLWELSARALVVAGAPGEAYEPLRRAFARSTDPAWNRVGALAWTRLAALLPAPSTDPEAESWRAPLAPERVEDAHEDKKVGPHVGVRVEGVGMLRRLSPLETADGTCFALAVRRVRWLETLDPVAVSPRGRWVLAMDRAWNRAVLLRWSQLAAAHGIESKDDKEAQNGNKDDKKQAKDTTDLDAPEIEQVVLDAPSYDSVPGATGAATLVGFAESENESENKSEKEHETVRVVWSFGPARVLARYRVKCGRE